MLTKELIIESPILINGASTTYRGDSNLMKILVDKDSKVVECATDDLKDDYDFMSYVVAKDGILLRYASYRLRTNPTLAFIAVKNNPEAHIYVDDDCWKNPKLAAFAIVNGLIKLCPEEYLNDPDFVYGLLVGGAKLEVLSLISEELSNNKLFFMKLVEVNGYCLFYGSIKIKKDLNLRKIAFGKTPAIVTNPEFILDSSMYESLVTTHQEYFFKSKFRSSHDLIKLWMRKNPYSILPFKIDQDYNTLIDLMKKIYIPLTVLSYEFWKKREVLIYGIRSKQDFYMVIDIVTDIYFDDVDVIKVALKYVPSYYKMLNSEMQHNSEIIESIEMSWDVFDEMLKDYISIEDLKEPVDFYVDDDIYEVD